MAYALRGNAHLALGDLAKARADAEMALATDPDNIEAVKFAAGLRATALNDLEGALALIEPARRAHPENAELRLTHAQVLALARRDDEAAQTLREYVRESSGPANLHASLRLAHYLYGLGRYDKSQSVLRQATIAHPQDPVPVLALARLLNERRSPESAERLLLASAAERESSAPFEEALAAFYSFTKQPEKVEAMLRRVIQEHGTGAPGLRARTALAKIRAHENRPDEARELLEQVLAENALDRHALTLSAKLALLGGDHSRAIGDLRTLVRDNPHASEVIWLLGVAYRGNGELDAAEQHFRNALSVAPHALSARLDLVQMLTARGEIGEARTLIEEALQRDPNERATLRALGQLEAGSRNWQRAAETGAALRKAHPDDAFGYQLGGMVAQASGDTRSATQAFQCAADLAPESTPALAALVGSLVADGRADAALERLRSAVRRHPDDPWMQRLLGWVLRGLGRLEEAESILTAAVELAREVPTAYRELALVLRAQEKLPRAAAVLEAGMLATGGSALILIELGQLYDELGRPEDAIGMYERYLETHPTSLPAANNLAMLLATRRTDEGSLDRAAALSERLRGSASPMFLDTVGWVAHRRGESARAIAVLEDVIARSPGVPTFQFHLGAALIEAGHTTRGREFLERSLGSGAAFPERDEAVALRENLAEVQQRADACAQRALAPGQDFAGHSPSSHRDTHLCRSNGRS